MLNLTDRAWGAFRIGELFTEIKRGKRLTKDSQISGDIPYISSSAVNNGVDNFISNTDNIYMNNDCLTIANSGSVGSTFYHDYSMILSDHVTALKSESFNKQVYLFLATIIKYQLRAKYDFNREINNYRLKRESIMLPINSDGQPDYDFMEQYIKERYEQAEKVTDQFVTHEVEDVVPLEEKEWGAFRIGELFEIKSGVRLVKDDFISGNIPFIGATDSNNGVTALVGNKNNSLDSNVLGVNYNGSVVENFYHPYEAIFSDDVKRLELKNKTGNEYIYLFLKTVISQQKIKYQYGYKFNAARMKRQTLMLPINSNGQPDYDFMENYMKHLQNKMTSSLTQIQLS